MSTDKAPTFALLRRQGPAYLVLESGPHGNLAYTG